MFAPVGTTRSPNLQVVNSGLLGIRFALHLPLEHTACHHMAAANNAIFTPITVELSELMRFDLLRRIPPCALKWPLGQGLAKAESKRVIRGKGP